MEEQTAQLGRDLATRYGAAVAVEYVDVYSPDMPKHPEVMQLLFRGNVPLPIISLNGEPRLAGGISLPMIGEEIEQLGVQPL